MGIEVIVYIVGAVWIFLFLDAHIRGIERDIMHMLGTQGKPSIEVKLIATCCVIIGAVGWPLCLIFFIIFKWEQRHADKV